MKSLRYMLCLLSGLLVLTHGCHHPQALYEEPPLPPIEQGKEYENRHKYAQAEQEYKQIEDAAAQNMTLNQLSSAWDNVNANILRAQERLQSDPNAAGARLDLAREYFHKALLCQQYLKEAQGSYPRDFVKGEAEYYYSEALRQAKQAKRLGQLPEAYLLISEMYLASQQSDLALRELKQLMKIHTQYARVYYAIGNVYLDTKKYDRVERYFIRAIKLDPDFIDAYYLLGKFYLEQKWYDYAAATFLEILRRKPNDSESFEALIQTAHELGEFYVDDGHYDQAIIIFQEILRVKSSYAAHQSLLAARQKKADALVAAKEARKQELEAQLAAPAPETTSAPEMPPVTEPKAEPTPEATPEATPETAAEPTADTPPPAEPTAEPTPEPTPEPTATDTPEPTPAAAPTVQLRNAPAALANADILDMIKQRGYHHPNDLSAWGLSGAVKGTMPHAYAVQSPNGVNVVTDQATGLMWQQAGSPEKMNWDQAKAYVEQLNQNGEGGFSDWRLPTIEELGSLVEFEQKNGTLYIDAAFDATQNVCWSADTMAAENSSWAASYTNGHLFSDARTNTNFVRAVRTLP